MQVSYDVKALLFDFDGVVINPTRHNQLEWVRFARMHGFDETTIYQRALGRPTRETMVELAGERFFEVQEALAEYESHSMATFDGIEVVPGVAGLLQRLPSNRWAIVTSSTRQLTLDRLDHFGLPRPLVLVAADDLAPGEGKPKPTPFSTAARILEVDPSETIAFEDAPSGITSARRARCKSVVILWTGDSPSPPPMRRGDSLIRDFTTTQVAILNGGLDVTVDSLTPVPVLGENLI